MSLQRYTFDEVRHFLSCLPDETLMELAKGPLPEEEGLSRQETCRVCSVLEKPNMQGPAYALIDWHDFVAKGLTFVRKVIDGKLGQEVENGLLDDVQELVGWCSYARCSAIYALAAAELEKRKRRKVELEADEDGEKLSHEDQLLDEEFEDADRMNDAEKVGDL